MNLKCVLSCSLLVVIVLSTTGCSFSGQKESRDVAVVSETVLNTDTINSEMKYMMESALVLEHTKSIYRMVRSECLSRGGSARNDLFDKMFCSKAFNKLVMAVRRKEANSNTLFFEIDHWTMTRDPGFVTFDEFEVTSLAMEPYKQASVSFTVYEEETYTPARVDLVMEDGRWVIDNFYDLKYLTDVRNSMWNYLLNDII